MCGYERPIPDSYWVEPGRLLAGKYPGAQDEAKARLKIQRFLDAGVTFFLNLTEEGRLEPYARWLGKAAVHCHIPIRDLGTPSPQGMVRILDTIDAALEEAGHVVYVHCWGGIGRTGTVVGCYLVRHGMGGQEALKEIARLREGMPNQRVSPETEAQRQMVLNWREVENSLPAHRHPSQTI